MKIIIYIFIILCFSISQTYADVTFQHIGSNDPVNDEGWQINSSIVGDISAGAIKDSGTEAWFVDDNSTVFGSTTNYHMTPTVSQINQANTYGWTLSSTLRVVDINDSVDSSVAVFYQIDQQIENLLFAMLFGSQADGDPIVRLLTGSGESGSDFILEGTGGGYHSYELVYDSFEASADLFVDGIERLSNYTGYTGQGGPSRVQWGSNRSDTTGQGNFSSVQFSIAPEPISSTLFIIGGATLGFRRFRKKFKK